MISRRAGLTPASGSSSSRSFGRAINARMISTSRFWPPLSRPAYSSVAVSHAELLKQRPRARDQLRLVALPVALAAHRPQEARAPLVGRRHEQVLHDREPRELAGELEGADDPVPGHPVGRPARDVHVLEQHGSALGRSAPTISLSAVDLPAPLGPIRPVTRPRGIAKLAPSTACTPPKSMRRSLTSRTGSPGAPGAGPPGSSEVATFTTARPWARRRPRRSRVARIAGGARAAGPRGRKYRNSRMSSPMHMNWTASAGLA